MTSAWLVARLGFHENLPDERGDGLDGTWHGEDPDQRQARIRQARLHAVPDRPDRGFGWQRRQRLDRIIGHQIIELAHQPLVGAEHNRANRTRNGWSFRSATAGAGALSRKQAPNPSSTVR